VVVGDELCERHFAGELAEGRHGGGWHGPTVLRTDPRLPLYIPSSSVLKAGLFASSYSTANSA